MTITLPDEWKEGLERKARAAGFNALSEYVCWLVQQSEETDTEPTPQDLGFAGEPEMEAKLLASLASGPAVRVTAEFWNDLRREVAARAGAATDPP